MTCIIVIFYNNPEFLLRQYATLKAFCMDKYDLIVVDNSTEPQAIKDIKYHADRLGLRYVKTNATSRNGSDSHAFAANFALHTFRTQYDTFCFLDHDCLAIKRFSPKAILGGKYLMAGLGQQNDKYYWPGCLIFDVSVSIDFTPRDGMDTGAGTSKAILAHKEQCLFFDEAYQQNEGFNKSQYNFYALIHNGTFMHFLNGSNWAGSEHNQERLNSLYNVLETLCEKNLKQ